MFNPAQKEFVDHITNLLKSTGRSVTVLDAPGGTGKTYLVKAIMKAFKGEIRVIAPTHKAASLYRKDHIYAETIHRFLKAKQDIDCETGELLFQFRSPPDHKLRMVIVDEASMVSQDMYQSILATGLHVVFVGDRCQVMPVGEELSPVFKHTPIFSLTENMRIKNNPDSISAMYLGRFREGVNSPSSKIRVERKTKAFMLEYFTKEDDTVALAWTNMQVRCLNDTIRRHLFKEDGELKPLYTDERLIFSGYRACPVVIDGEQLCYYSSDEVHVKSLHEVTLPIPYYLCPHQLKGANRVTPCNRCCIKGRSCLSKNVDFYEIYDQFNTKWFYARGNGESHLKEVLSDFKRSCMHMKDKALWWEFKNFEMTYAPSLFYRYALTVHKAQGSQYKVCFVDIDNIRFNRKPNERVRLEYTAASRFTDLLFFV